MQHRVYKDTQGREFDVWKEEGTCEMRMKPVEPIPDARYESATLQLPAGGGTPGAQSLIYVTVEGPGGSNGLNWNTLNAALAGAAEWLTETTANADKVCAEMDAWMKEGK